MHSSNAFWLITNRVTGDIYGSDFLATISGLQFIVLDTKICKNPRHIGMESVWWQKLRVVVLYRKILPHLSSLLSLIILSSPPQARARGVETMRDRMYSGEKINITEVT